MIGPSLSVTKDTEYGLNVIGVSILGKFHKSFHLICKVFQLNWKKINSEKGTEYLLFEGNVGSEHVKNRDTGVFPKCFH